MPRWKRGVTRVTRQMSRWKRGVTRVTRQMLRWKRGVTRVTRQMLRWKRGVTRVTSFWVKVDEVFQKALERAPETREAFLDEASINDADLRRQVELLLSKDAQAGSLLE